MKIKKIVTSTGIIVVIVVSIYLIFINTNITGHTIKEDKPEKIKEKDCWTLNDGRKICYLGKTNVTDGNIEEVDGRIKIKKEKNKSNKPDYSSSGSSSSSSTTSSVSVSASSASTGSSLVSSC